MSPILVLNFVAGWSIFYSAVWYKNVFLIEKNPELNSLKNRSANLSAKRVDIQRVVSGNETTLRLPCRDTSDQLSSVLIFALATLFGAFFFCFVIGNMGVGCVQLGGFLSLIPLALFSLCFLRAIMRIGGPAWRILLGRSRHELSIANGRLATCDSGGQPFCILCGRGSKF